MKRYLLLQARNLDDIVRPEERKAFAQQLQTPLETVDTCDVLNDELSLSRALTYDAVLVGGAGEYSVLDDDPRIKGFINHLGELTSAKVPVFASCFGFQALVLALGGTVVKDVPNAEVGTYILKTTKEAAADPVFSDLPSPFLAQMGHQDRAETLPESLINFAHSQRAPFQAFRVKDTPVYATQFHPELTFDDNRRRFARYMKIYGALFGEEEAQKRMDSHRPSPESNRLLRRFATEVLNAS
jgi:GMP synthase (glutamine-hydrolysing)